MSSPATILSTPPQFRGIEGQSVRLTTARGTFHCRMYGPSDAEWTTAQQQRNVDDSVVTTSSSSPPPAASPATPPPVLVCVHGAGMSSMSFGPCASIMTCSDNIDGHPFTFRVVSLDLRCHGESHRDGGESILTLDTLVEDFVHIVLALRETIFPLIPRFYYAGHSLGGSIVAHAATQKRIAALLGGVVMLDIVETVAKVSLKFMNSVLDKRPVSFKSTAEAAHWFVSQGGMFNEAIAKLTVPSLLKECECEAVEAAPSANELAATQHSLPLTLHRWTWRTDLRRTEPCWDTWFDGMDKTFVSLPCPKMLLLATTDRLDKELTMAQMQGKFQLEIIGTQGHYVMEDEPALVAGKLMRFVHRVETLSRKLPSFNKH